MLWFKIIYVLALSVIIFFIQNINALLIVFMINILFFVLSGAGLKNLYLIIKRTSAFFLILFLTFLFFSENCKNLYVMKLWNIKLGLCREGIYEGIVMLIRIYTIIILTSFNKKSINELFRRIGLPKSLSLAFEFCFAFIEGEAEKEHPPKRRIKIRDLLKGDLNSLGSYFNDKLSGIKDEIRKKNLNLPEDIESEVVILTALGVITLSLRMVKVLPGVPFAPGHKGMIIIPLYIISSETIKTGWGGTKLGTLTGILSFFTGQDRFGIFEIIKHILPGIFVDSIYKSNLFKRTFEITSPVLIYSVLGILLASFRFATIILIAIITSAPKPFFIVLLPALLVQITFGGFSGFVTSYLIKFIKKYER